MPFPSAPTSGQITAIRESYSARTYAIFAPNTVVFKARANGTPAGDSIADIEFDGVTIGTIAAALEGYSVRFSRTDDIFASYFEGRVRTTETSGTTLRIGETSAAIQDDDYIFVIEDVKLSERLPRVDANDVIFVDYDKPFEELVPVIQGLQSAYVIQLSGGVADLALAPSVLIPTAGAAAATWNWSNVGGASFQAGSSSSQNVTLRWTTAGVRRVRVYHTDDGGRAGWFTFVVAVVDADFNVPLLLGEDDVNYAFDLTEGGSASLRAFDGVDSILDDTLVILFSAKETFGGETTPIVSNVNFVGRLRQQTVDTEPDPRHTLLAETRYVIEGPLSQLGRLPLSPFALRNVSTPTEYGEINDLTLWRAVVFQATALCTLANLHSLEFEDTTNTYLLPLLGTEDASAADNMDETMFGINAALVFAPQGELYIARNVNYLDDGDRPASLYDFSVSAGDIRNASVNRQHLPTIGRLIGYAGSYDETATTFTVVQAIAPAVAPGSAQGRAEVNGQVLAANLDVSSAQVAAAERIARDLAQKNPKDAIDVTLVDSLHWLVPSVHQVYVFTITPDENNAGLNYDAHTTWICTRVNIAIENNGKVVTATFEQTTQSGDSLVFAQIPPGEVGVPTTVLPPIVTTIIPIGDLGLADPNPDPDDSPDDVNQDTVDTMQPGGPPDPESETPDPNTRGGNNVAILSNGGVWITNAFTKSSYPPWVNRSPAITGMIDLALPWSGSKALAIQQDIANTNVWRWGNIWGSNSVVGVTLLNVLYHAVRFASNNTVAYVYSNDADIWQHTFDFTAESGSDPDTTYGQGGWQVFSTRGSYVSGTGFVAAAAAPAESNETKSAWIYRDCGQPTNFSEIEVIYTRTCGTGPFADTPTSRAGTIRTADSAPPSMTNATLHASQGSCVPGTDLSFNTGGISAVNDFVLTEIVSDRSLPHTGSATIKQVIIRGTGTNPFIVSGSSGASSRRSTDSGATFEPDLLVGTAPAAPAGFDSQRIGTAVLAAAAAQVRKSTGGGAYSNAVSGDSAGTYAAAIVYYGKNADHYLFATASGVLYKVDGSGKNDITPNDGVNNGFPTGQHCLSVHPGDPTRIYAILDFGGTHKFCRSTNSGSTWTIVTGFSANAVCVDCSPYNKNQVIVGDGTVIYYSADGGASFVAKTIAGGDLVKAAFFRR